MIRRASRILGAALRIIPVLVLLWIVGSVSLAPHYPRRWPAQPVEIARDEWGVPHIFAAGRRDLFFGQGYATAADRIFQMDWSRRGLLGRRAEVIGRSAIVSDFQSRALDLEAVARGLYARLAPDEREAVEAYADGVNEWLRTHALPVEFRRLGYRPRPWRPWDCLLVWRGMALTLTDLTDDLADAAPGRSTDLLGSNAWAVAGRKTRSGAPLLAGDPHLGYAMPGPFHRVALADSQDAATGFALPGVPGLILGRNRNVAWTATAFEGDEADVFTFPYDAGSPGRYHGPSGWARIVKRRPWVWLRWHHGLSIPVFWQPIETTPLGPVVRRAGGRIYVLRWAGREALPNEGLVPVHTLTVRDVPGLRPVLARLGLPDINVVGADTRGNIAHFVAGRIPLRAAHAGPRDGLDPAQGWTGFVPFDSLPAQVNPAEGFVVSANGPPPPGREYLGHGWPTVRERRIRALIAGNDSLTAGAMVRMQGDHLVDGAIEETAARLAGLRSDNLPAPARRAASLLQRWDGRAEADSVAPTLFRMWQTFGDGAPGLARALSYLGRKLGPDLDGWRWGRLHQAVLKHPLASIDSSWSIGPFPRSGDRGTVDVGGYAAADTTSWPPILSRHGPAARFVADLADDGFIEGVLLAGESGDPESPHYADQLDLWRDGRVVRFTAPGERPAIVESSEWLTRSGEAPPLPHAGNSE